MLSEVRPLLRTSERLARVVAGEEGEGRCHRQSSRTCPGSRRNSSLVALAAVKLRLLHQIRSDSLLTPSSRATSRYGRPVASTNLTTSHRNWRRRGVVLEFGSFT